MNALKRMKAFAEIENARMREACCTWRNCRPADQRESVRDRVWNALSTGPKDSAALADIVKVKRSTVNSALRHLEMSGAVKREVFGNEPHMWSRA